MEAAAAEPHGRPGGEDELRRLRSLLEARQRHLRARIAACEELTAEMAALQATLGADCRPPCVSSGPGSGEGRRAEAGRAPRPGPRRPAPAPRPPALPRSLTRPAPGPAAASSEPGGEGDAEP